MAILQGLHESVMTHQKDSCDASPWDFIEDFHDNSIIKRSWDSQLRDSHEPLSRGFHENSLTISYHITSMTVDLQDMENFERFLMGVRAYEFVTDISQKSHESRHSFKI